jgi:hypothetical protein
LIANLSTTLVAERPVPASDSDAAHAWTAHNEIASRLAHESTVLLQNRKPSSVRAVPGRLSAISIFLCKSLLYGAFVCAQGA